MVRLPAPSPRVLQTETLPAYRFWILDGQMHAPEAEAEEALAAEALEAVGGPDGQNGRKRR